MKEYISYQIQVSDTDQQEILVALLSEFGFEGFEQTDNLLIANGHPNLFSTAAVERFLTGKALVFTSSIIKEENWNKLWEADFHPIVIEQFCAIRAGFHAPIPDVLYKIVITPKMSFGTGHHATTWMMLKQMQAIDFQDKSVIDFGTGTGILAILAEKKGAVRVDAIDYDEWCIENGNENILDNNCTHIHLRKADHPGGLEPADVVLANINKNVILDNFKVLETVMKEGAVLVLSGILKADETDIDAVAGINGLVQKAITEKDGWLCIAFARKGF